MNEKELIKIDHLTKKYGKKTALKDFSCSLKGGRIVGLLGPNGSGKTTLIKVLNGLLKDYEGAVLIDGQMPNTYTKSIISYLPDETYLEDWMKARDALSMFHDLYKDFDLEKCLSLMKRMELHPDMRIKAMSKGMKEKFQLALVMSRKAKIYILDEPIGGVDPAARELILEIILNNYSEDSLVLISTHLISDIEKVFEEVIFIKDGELVVSGNAEELRQERGQSIDEIFREVFKC
ncbi:ABC transporter ATP-binding protein [Anaerorhabdus sp.]|jgi:ABC-2 type transport system ATP-binding protein|uniref:ABC transporter ATP-binding protein n=1 Tax=Anaerorhabdus sp. TaxID=1872524 RepID=UPI002FC80136